MAVCVSIYQQLNDIDAKNYETIQNWIKCVIECWDNGISLLVHTQLYSVYFSTHLLWRQWAMLNETANIIIINIHCKVEPFSIVKFEMIHFLCFLKGFNFVAFTYIAFGISFYHFEHHPRNKLNGI